MKQTLLPIPDCLGIVAEVADRFADVVAHDAPSSFVHVLDELDAVAGCDGDNPIAFLIDVDAVAKLSGVCRFMRDTFHTDCLGWDDVALLEQVGFSLAVHIAHNAETETPPPPPPDNGTAGGLI
jgi:hypothetical protein